MEASHCHSKPVKCRQRAGPPVWTLGKEMEGLSLTLCKTQHWGPRESSEKDSQNLYRVQSEQVFVYKIALK